MSYDLSEVTSSPLNHVSLSDRELTEIVNLESQRMRYACTGLVMVSDPVKRYIEILMEQDAYVLNPWLSGDNVTSNSQLLD